MDYNVSKHTNLNCQTIKNYFISGTMSVAYREMIDIWHQQKNTTEHNSAVLNHVLGKMNLKRSNNDPMYARVTVLVRKFISKLQAKWSNANRTLSIFMRKKFKWLSGYIELLT